MSEECEFLEKCGFFNNYEHHTEAIKYQWIVMFCKDREKSKECKRKEFRLKHGKPPADNMTPTGRMLEI